LGGWKNMQNELWKNGLVVGIVLLFVGAGVTSGFNINFSKESKPMNRGWL
jgi:hypothetical protein